MNNLLFLLLPVAAASGWYFANKKQRSESKTKNSYVPKDYLVGLNFLLNEQPDRAVDIFIKMLEVDTNTVETHLALGSLFRRRGEVDRAIRIHQNLIARPHLIKEHRMQALLALGQDYMRAGVLDRAERIFLEVVENGGDSTLSLKLLIDIYQQEKAWPQAILTAKKLAIVTGDSMQTNIAHYYCELAQLEHGLKNNDAARKHLRKALVTDKNCVRASLLHGDIEYEEKRFKAALKYYKQVKIQDPDFLSEAVGPIVKCYKQLNNEADLIQYLQDCLREYPRITIALVLANELQHINDTQAAIAFVTQYLQAHPSIRGLKRLIEMQMGTGESQSVANLQILIDITASMLKNKPIYRCNHCGFGGKTIHWICPRCRTWSTVKPIHGLEGD